MKKIFTNKLFLILTPTITFIISIVAGYLLGFETLSTQGFGHDYRYNFSKFNFRLAFGYWLIGIILTLIVFLLCVMIYSINKKDSKNN